MSSFLLLPPFFFFPSDQSDLEPQSFTDHRLFFGFAENRLLVGFACGHVFHLSCLLKYDKPPSDDEELHVPDVVARMAAGEQPVAVDSDRSVGPKVDRAALLRTLIGNGCPVAVHKDGD